MACVQSAEQVAAERCVTIFPISREDLPWWETLLFFTAAPTQER